MTDDPSDATILVVDDEPNVADAYALRLGTQYGETITAYGGQEAIDHLDDSEVDVALLDRRMPDVSGDDVAEHIQDTGQDCRVIMVTAVDPDFDILDMPFDDYLQKPVEKEDMFAAVEQQLNAVDYDEQLSEYFSVRSKIAVLEAEKSDAQLEDNNKYQRLQEQAAEMDEELDETVDEFDDLNQAFTSIERS